MKEMSYLVLMLFWFPLLRALNCLYHELVPAPLGAYVLAHVIKRHPSMPKLITNPITTYLNDQGMPS